VAVRLTEGGASVVVEGGRAWPSADRFFAQAASVAELWWRPEEGRLRRLAARDEVRSAGASFVQVNARVAAALREHVLDRVRAHAPARVIDAYAGMGDTAVPLARDGRTVVAIELDGEAVDSFRHRLPSPSAAIAGRVEDHLPAALPADVVLLNPPRAGVDARVTAALEASATPPRAILYVSCDPATLARDVARMPRYRVASLRAYDMFPQTAHVETVCELVPEAA
jgi:23S rRNA (uracil1939-C5)-methyltransferase